MQDRIYKAEDGQWYFRVRGNAAVGPYEHRPDAERELAQRLRQWRSGMGPKRVWPRNLHPFRLVRRSVPRQS